MQNKPLYIKIIIFLLFVYLAVPFIMGLLAAAFNFVLGYTLNFSRNNIFSFVLILLFIYFNKKELAKIKSLFSSKDLGIFLILAIFLFYLNFRLKYTLNNYLTALPAIMILDILTYLIASILLFIAIFSFDYTKTILTKFIAQLSTLFVFFISFFFLGLALERTWLFFSKLVAAANYNLLSIFFKNTSLAFSDLTPLLRLNNFSIAIGSPCSGTDSLLLFTYLFFIVIFFSKKNYNFKTASLAFFIGLIGMFATAVLRVFLLMAVGNHYPNFALTLFHSNLGWSLFVIYFFVFYYLFSKLTPKAI